MYPYCFEWLLTTWQGDLFFYYLQRIQTLVEDHRVMVTLVGINVWGVKIVILVDSSSNRFSVQLNEMSWGVVQYAFETSWEYVV